MIAKLIKSLFSTPEKLEPVSVKGSFLDIFKSEMQETISQIESLDKDFEEAEQEIRNQIEKENELINRDGFVKSAINNKILLKSRLGEVPELKRIKKQDLLAKLQDQLKNIKEIEGMEFEKSEEDSKTIFTPKSDNLEKSIEAVELYPVRENMPQLKDTKDFIDYLIANGVLVERKTLEAHKIIHKQVDLDSSKIDAIAKEYSEGKEYSPCVVSKEGFVLDGNHRIAAMKKNGSQSIEVDQVDKEFDPLLKSAFEFLKASQSELKEMIEEHEQLVEVLESDSHEDDKKEAKKQKKELAGYKKKLKKSEREQFEEFIQKAKYIKREGGPGNYRYYYSDGSGGASQEKKDSKGSGFIYTPQENLSKEHKEIEERFGTYLKENFEEAKARYEAANGSILNTDNARELSDDYEGNRAELSAAVHEPASSFIKKLYAEKLAQPAPKGKKNLVLFTAGGTGAGKTTGMEKVDASSLEKSQIIYDTNMNGFEKSKQKIDQALAAGKSVRLSFTFRDPIEAFQLGAVPRSLRIGRTVPISEHVKTHLGSMDALSQMEQEYKGNKKVRIAVIDNSRGRDNAELSSIEFVKEKRKLYNAEELTKELNKLNEKNYKDGKITEAHYKGFKG